MIWVAALGWDCIYNTILVLIAESYNPSYCGLYAAGEAFVVLLSEYVIQGGDITFLLQHMISIFHVNIRTMQ